jgi:ADP-ribose pyrophosphatase YjhB (NUDIX family)
MEDLKVRLNAILEGAMNNPDQEIVLENVEFDQEMISETVLAMMIEAAEEAAFAMVKDFIMENAQSLIKNNVLTESTAGQSVFVLDNTARRKKAENMMKLNYARKANDPRYFKAIALRRVYKRIIEQIRSDPRYSAAHTQTMQMQFRAFVPNAQAMNKQHQNQRTKLQH